MLYDEFRKEKMVALKEKDKLKNKVITNILSELTYIKKELKQEPTAKCKSNLNTNSKRLKHLLKHILDPKIHQRVLPV